MRVFVTGATGFIGTPTVKELIKAGHTVVGLTRSEAGAKALAAAGAEVQHGSLEDLESLRAGAKAADGVIHLAFNHDFSKFAENCAMDRQAIEAMGSVLAGSARPLVVTSGVLLTNRAAGEPAREEDAELGGSPRLTERAAAAVAAQGVNVSIVRLPQVHDPVKQGLITYLVALAREKGVSAYVGDGKNRWAAAAVLDVAQLYRLVLEKAEPGARYHAVAEEGVALRDIAEVIGRGLKVPVKSLTPEEAPGHFGWLAMFAGLDVPSSSAQTRERLGWKPSGPGLIADLERMDYSASV